MLYTLTINRRHATGDRFAYEMSYETYSSRNAIEQYVDAIRCIAEATTVDIDEIPADELSPDRILRFNVSVYFGDPDTGWLDTIDCELH
jgi:hypothetical protein